MHYLLARDTPMLLQAGLNGSFRLVCHFESNRFGSKGKSPQSCSYYQEQFMQSEYKRLFVGYL